MGGVIFASSSECRQLMSHWDFEIEVRDDEIIVTLPGTNYTVTYYKPANSPQLGTPPAPSAVSKSSHHQYEHGNP